MMFMNDIADFVRFGDIISVTIRSQTTQNSKLIEHPEHWWTSHSVPHIGFWIGDHHRIGVFNQFHFMGIDVDTDYYYITGKELPFADEVQEDTTVEKLNDLYHTYENLPSDLKEDYAELMCYFSDLDELHRYRNNIIHYSWCKNMTDVARHILNNDPDFTSLSESVTRYFDYEAYGQYLDDNGRFVETDHGIYELP